MRTRKSDTPKTVPAKKTPVRKASAKNSPNPSGTAAESTTLKSPETKRRSAVRGKKASVSPATPEPIAISGSDQPSVEEVKTSAAAAQDTAETKVGSGAKSGVRRTQRKTRTPASAKAVSVKAEKSTETLKDQVHEPPKEEEVVGLRDLDGSEKVEPIAGKVGEFAKMGETAMEVAEQAAEDTGESAEKEQTDVKDVEELMMEEQVPMEKTADVEEPTREKQAPMEVEKPTREKQAPMEVEVLSAKNDELPEPADKQQPSNPEKGEGSEEVMVEQKEDIKSVEDKDDHTIESFNMEKNIKDDLQGEGAQPEMNEYDGNEALDEYGDRVDFEDHDGEDPVEDDTEEPAEKAETMDEEQRELVAMAKERRNKKEHEIFVGGLDRDAVEEDVKKVFENIGEVVEVRLHKEFSNNKNKGYAFVKFADKEHAKRALLEMKNPLICGKRCGTAPSEDNDTLFLGNICNTWTKEAIKQKLKDYGVERVENITLVADVQHEGLSRGFAFLEFFCHADAMLAYKRLQKPDVVFGHPQRTAKVAFAEPLREPDPEIMAEVKSVFLDGLPPQWDEDRVRQQLKSYGDIVRVVLARNMSTAKRKDFGFVDFSTHDAAVACINGVNSADFGDGNSKTKVKARLSNPLPKTQAVKGEMCGGFRIGHGGSGTFSRFGRGLGRGGHHFNRTNNERGRGFYHHGHGQFSSRVGPNDYGFDNRYADFHGRQFSGRGGRRGSFRGGHFASGRGVAHAGPSRPNLQRPWHDVPDRGSREHIPFRRQPFHPDQNFHESFAGRPYDDPYFYDDGAHGIKRPFYTTDHDPDYTQHSRIRPRLDYNDPAVPFHGTRFRDTYGAGSGVLSQDYYGSDYGAYPSYYGGGSSFGGGYYY